MPEAGDGRWAVYYAPPATHPLWRAACRWLGRDPESGETFAPPDDLGHDEWRALVDRPAGYGFHATLKPPFRLAAGKTSDDLRSRITDMATGRTPFFIDGLRVARLDGFLALRPTDSEPRLDALAADCVRLLDGLRRSPAGAELAGRRAGLTHRQRSLLERWGYPYVFEEFRFHMTLTAPVDSIGERRARPVINELLGDALDKRLPVDGVALYHQPAPGTAFHLVERFPFSSRETR